MNLEPVVPDEFQKIMIRPKNKSSIDYTTYFKPIIDQANHFAIGPFCWFIPDQSDLSVHAVSENIKSLHLIPKKNGKIKMENFGSIIFNPKIRDLLLQHL